MEKEEILVSVVVPCYNAEKYIRRTMNAICAQTFSGYEIIVVNDGSTDGTLNILEEFKSRYSNLMIVTKQNDHGRTTVRRGLECARGRYVCVVDNDDIISEHYIEKLYTAAEENDSDMVVCGFQRGNIDENVVYSKEMVKRKGTVALDQDYGVLLEINTSLWNKMIRREIYSELLKVGDRLFWMDMVCLAYIYLFVHRVTFVSEVLYYYQVRNGSSINSLKLETVNTAYNSMLTIKEYYEEKNKHMVEVLNAFMFVHAGISFPYRMYNNSSVNFNMFFSNNLDYLQTHFDKWLSNQYVSLKYVLKNHRNTRILICKVFYRVHLFKPFLAVYSFVTSKTGKEIKW